MRQVAIGFWLFILISIKGLALPSAVFFYGPNPPLKQLQLFNTAIIEPSHLENPESYKAKQSKLFAYVSLGELESKSPYFKQIKSKWIIAHNKNWKSEVMDASNPKWQQFFLNTIIKRLWQKGYRNFFLDTVDSYHLAKLNDKQKQAQEKGLIQIIHLIKQRYPEAKLIINRGFEILPQVKNDISGIAAESLYYGYNSSKKSYQKVSENDRKWLLSKLNEAKQLGLNVFVIDYLPNTEKQKAIADAKQIASLGFIPYISTPELNSLGISTILPQPRKVMMLYSSKEEPEKVLAPPFTFLSMPLEYEGYVPKLYSIEKPLPEYPLHNRVAGIIIWLESPYPKPASNLIAWVKKALQEHIPVLLMGDINYFTKNTALRRQLGITVKTEYQESKHVSIAKQSDLINFEIAPRIEPLSFSPLKLRQANIDLQLKDKKGNTEDVVATTPWGGIALSPYFATTLPDTSSRYIVNPFKFVRKALKLNAIPVPDVTTDSGRRILTSHIDGDAFYSRSEWLNGPYAAESLYRTILQKYKIPIAISIVEGEIGPTGLDPKHSKQLMAIAREIFALPWVEIASHSYSHPFDWNKAYKTENKKVVVKGERLDVPNYIFNLKREIIGSTDFINKELAPKGKRCNIFLWTGDTDPPAQAIALTYEAGLLNINGGDTRITKSLPSLTAVSGLGVYKDGWLQIFAPIQNENIYTNNWKGPFYGFKRVIETFELTDKPRRLKPIDIYYHFYSATKAASLKALDTVYDWALKQPVTPLPTSSYIRKVIDFYNITLAKTLDGQWLIHGNGKIQEFRYASTKQYPVINASVIGFNRINNNWYIHTLPMQYIDLAFSSETPNTLYLHDSNSPISDRWSFTSYIPLIARFKNASKCQFKLNGQMLVPTQENGLTVIHLKEYGKKRIHITC
jgi:polysaccharide biosynthesis protein PelA